MGYSIKVGFNEVTIKLGFNEVTTLRFWRAIAAEFVGCFFFLLFVTCVTIGWGNPKVNVSANNVEIALGIGLAITSLAQAFGHVSGGHLNPAVSLGMVLAGRISMFRGLFYIIAQVVGGIAGAAVTKGCTTSVVVKNLGATFLAPSVKQGQGFALEFLFTFMLVFFVLSITDEKKNTEPYGTTLGIGIYIVVAHVCLIPFTGCGINPARSFGPAVMMGIWDDQWIYWVAPFSAAILAAPVYTFIFYVSEEDSLDVTEVSEVQMMSKDSNI